MKKIVILCAAVSICMFACKKEKAASPAAKKETVDVSFNVSGAFTGSTSPVTEQSKKRTNVYSPTNTQFVTALFYDANSVLVGRIDQNSANDDYRTVKFKLPLHTLIHAFFIAAADSTFKISLKKGNTGNLGTYPNGYPVLTYPNTIFPPNSNIYTLEKDYYVEYPISESVQLERAVSQLTVTLTDALPASALNNLLSVSQPKYSTGLDLVNRTGDIPYTSASYGLPPLPGPEDVGKTGFTRTAYIWPTQNNFIKIFDGSFVSADVPIPDGAFMANQQYTFKGILFLDTRQYFSFFINGDWNASITIPISVPTDTN